MCGGGDSFLKADSKRDEQGISILFHLFCLSGSEAFSRSDVQTRLGGNPDIGGFGAQKRELVEFVEARFVFQNNFGTWGSIVSVFGFSLIGPYTYPIREACSRLIS